MKPQNIINLKTSVLGLTCTALLFACNSGPALDSDSQGVLRETAIGQHSRLSPGELNTYLADRLYIQSLAEPGVAVRLNFADARMLRFVKSRLKIAGKTEAKAPYLYELIELRRQEHLATGQTQGLLPNAAYESTPSAERGPDHYLEQTQMVGDSAVGVASSTFPDGSYWTYLDTGIYDIGGLPLSDLPYVEEFGGGINPVAKADGDLSLSTISGYTFDTYQMEDSATGFDDSYLFSSTGANAAAGRVDPPTYQVEQITDPVDRAPAALDGKIQICLSRSNGNCDYHLLGMWDVKVPLKGSVRLTSAHHFDDAAIAQMQTELNNGQTGAQYGQAKLVLLSQTYGGGSCRVGEQNAQYSSMKVFWNRVTLSADKKTLSWNLTGNHAAFFHNSCQLVQDKVKLTLRLPLPVLDDLTNSVAFRTAVTLSNDPNAWMPDYVFKPMTMRNSCLAEGTIVQLANGKRAPIESIAIGDRIFNPFLSDGKAVTVMDTTVGTEREPMVRIEDAAGHSLLLTEMHPVQTPNRGMVQARYLRVGDTVTTDAGMSELVAVTREPFAGKVYNLEVGSSSEMTSLSSDQTVIYANGIVVGDTRIQTEYEDREMNKPRGDVLSRLPKVWHRDYANSLAPAE